MGVLTAFERSRLEARFNAIASSALEHFLKWTFAEQGFFIKKLIMKDFSVDNIKAQSFSPETSQCMTTLMRGYSNLNKDAAFDLFPEKFQEMKAMLEQFNIATGESQAYIKPHSLQAKL